jgi:hypothetical protein
MLPKICLFILIFAFIQNIYAQVNSDSCNCEVERILKTYKKYENKYKEEAWNKLYYYLNIDTVIKHYFFNDDSLNFKKLKLYLKPLLKFTRAACNFKSGENVCRYLEFDSINYESIAGFFFEDKLAFFITRGHNDCDISSISLGSKQQPWCDEQITFISYFYGNIINHKCQTPKYNITIDSVFRFNIEGFQPEFRIENGKMSITYQNYNDDLLALLDKPNLFIHKIDGESRIHYCSRKCPVGGLPWWKFWEWDIFH